MTLDILLFFWYLTTALCLAGSIAMAMAPRKKARKP